MGVLMARQVNGLMNEMYIEGFGVSHNVENVDVDNINIENTENINTINTDDNTPKELKEVKTYTMEELVDSFAPHIYGLTQVKKLLLLSLISAPTIINNGMKIRGNINLLLV